jgi:hypothetical protein
MKSDATTLDNFKGGVHLNTTDGYHQRTPLTKELVPTRNHNFAR